MANATNRRLPHSSEASTSDYEQAERLDGLVRGGLAQGMSSSSLPQDNPHTRLLCRHDDPAEQLRWSHPSDSAHAILPSGSSPLSAKSRSSLPSRWLSQTNAGSLTWEPSVGHGSVNPTFGVTGSVGGWSSGHGSSSCPDFAVGVKAGSASAAPAGRSVYDLEGAAKACNQESANPVAGSPKSNRKRKRSGHGAALMEQVAS